MVFRSDSSLKHQIRSPEKSWIGKKRNIIGFDFGRQKEGVYIQVTKDLDLRKLFTYMENM